jgi:hypothetical protein
MYRAGMSIWFRAALWILDHPRPIVAVIILCTLIFGYLMRGLETDHAAGNFAAADETFYEDFRETGRVFGRSETILYVVFHETEPFDADFLRQIDSLTTVIEAKRGVESVLSLANVPFLDRVGSDLRAEPVYDADLSPNALTRRILDQPFLRGLLISEDSTATMMMVRVEPEFNNRPERIDLVDEIEMAAGDLPGQVALAGFPYLRTQYARRVTREAPLFTVFALLISLAFLFMTFRAWRAIVLPTLIVGLGIIWTFGLMAVFDQKLNIVTAVLPALIVIIGMANVIHLTTKFFDQYLIEQSRREAMIVTLRTVGVATFLTSLTTAIGFAVLMLSGNRLLEGFGGFAAVGIMVLYGLSITLIPIAYTRARPPRSDIASLATHDRFADYFDAKARLTRRYSRGIVISAAVFVLLGVVGVTRISTDIFVFSDFYPDDPLRRSLSVFEEKFGGVLPMEVVIESDRPGRFKTLGAMRDIEELEQRLARFEPVGMAFSAVDLVKLGNQAYFGGNPGAYRLPSGYELPFIQDALDHFLGGHSENDLIDNLPLFIDSTYSRARIYLGVADIGTEQMNVLADTVRTLTASAFSGEEYDVIVTGTAIVSTRSGESLVRNLIVSLTVALVVISVLMAFLFRSSALTLISLAPNVIPLLLVGGAMGFAGITLKPSTALIFSLAFGIAVDDTIHFLAKYRVHRGHGMDRDGAVRKTLGETGKAIIFTSLVLMGGFLVFTLSSFGGTVNMGALTALTLGVAMMANLFLLPALLYRYGPAEHRKA